MRILSLMLLLASAETLHAGTEGERLAYVVGCVGCHHQTPREIMNAPPLAVVQGYDYAQFETLLRTGRTASGRDLPGLGSIMGIVAIEQLNWMTDAEIRAIYRFLREDWTDARAAEEEAKIPVLYARKLAGQDKPE